NRPQEALSAFAYATSDCTNPAEGFLAGASDGFIASPAQEAGRPAKSNNKPHNSPGTAEIPATGESIRKPPGRHLPFQRPGSVWLWDEGISRGMKPGRR
ncbi:MAG: DUF3846 domain-containing protein, partial [Thermoguttaceae bacterium]|nr:DUF3846 domain-containing protein [Thermoguttaceae bacterium]